MVTCPAAVRAEPVCCDAGPRPRADTQVCPYEYLRFRYVHGILLVLRPAARIVGDEAGRGRTSSIAGWRLGEWLYVVRIIYARAHNNMRARINAHMRSFHISHTLVIAASSSA
jgi:hypothetical protein